MSGASYATASDVSLRWPSLPSGQESSINQQCQDASLILRQQYPGIDAQVTSGAVDPDVLTYIVCQMVKRSIQTVTPGAAQESVGTGPYSHSVTYANPHGNLYVTSAEDAMIRGYQPRAGSFDMSPDVV